MSITVYTAPQCVQCAATKRAFAKAGINYREVNLAANESAREYVVNTLGYGSAPVVEVDGIEHWSGFRPDRIKPLAN